MYQAMRKIKLCLLSAVLNRPGHSCNTVEPASTTVKKSEREETGKELLSSPGIYWD